MSRTSGPSWTLASVSTDWSMSASSEVCVPVQVFMDIVYYLFNTLSYNFCLSGNNVELGNRVEVRVESVDIERKRIGLQLVKLL